MKPMNTEMYRKILVALRAQLRGEVNLLTDIALDAILDQPSAKDQGVCRGCRTAWRTSVASGVRDFVENLIDRKEAMLYHVDHAIRRIEEGTYGTCLDCKTTIPEKWLLTLPYAARCAACHSQRLAA